MVRLNAAAGHYNGALSRRFSLSEVDFFHLVNHNGQSFIFGWRQWARSIGKPNETVVMSSGKGGRKVDARWESADRQVGVEQVGQD